MFKMCRGSDASGGLRIEKVVKDFGYLKADTRTVLRCIWQNVAVDGPPVNVKEGFAPPNSEEFVDGYLKSKGVNLRQGSQEIVSRRSISQGEEPEAFWQRCGLFPNTDMGFESLGGSDAAVSPNRNESPRNHVVPVSSFTFTFIFWISFIDTNALCVCSRASLAVSALSLAVSALRIATFKAPRVSRLARRI
jgi:hypothetical protein